MFSLPIFFSLAHATLPCLPIFFILFPLLSQPTTYVIEALGSSAEIPTRFAVKVRLVSWWPSDPRRMCVPSRGTGGGQRAGTRGAARGNNNNGWVYFFALRLEDDTGALDAIISDEVARWFLGNDVGESPEACDLSLPENRPVLERIEAALKKYQGDPVDVVIESFLVANERPGEGGGPTAAKTKRFRLCIAKRY